MRRRHELRRQFAMTRRNSPDLESQTELQRMRYISRGFWQREGELLALASLDEAAGFFGPGLALHAFRFEAAGGE